MYAEDANHPDRLKQETLVRDIWDKGTCGMRRAERAESQWKCATCLHLKEGQGSLNQADQINLSQK
ncbi:hypothetical protein KI387_018806, partial [Taxus chinensis]